MKNFIGPDIHGLIFDCDGTLVDSMPLHMEAWKNALNRNNYIYDKDFLYSLKGMKEEEIMVLYNKKFKTDLNPQMIVRLKHEFFMKHINDVKPISEIVEIAKENFNKLPLAVVSGSVSNIVRAELNVLGILNLFKVVLTADDPFKPKPDPDIFYAAAEKLNLKPEECIVFEDGDAGLQAARKAGMKTVDIREYVNYY